jgi:hypothetical protein
MGVVEVFFYMYLIICFMVVGSGGMEPVVKPLVMVTSYPEEGIRELIRKI